jgi:hypothetical protein
MVLGVRGAVALTAVLVTLALAAAGAGAATPVGSCVQPGYHCVSEGRWREAVVSTDPKCKWTYDVDWGDGASSSFVSKLNVQVHVDHRYDTAHHHLYKIVIDVPPGVSTDPDHKCRGGRYTERVEIPGPAVKPCVPARGTAPPACKPLGVKTGSSLLDQVPRLGRTTLDFLLMGDIRELRKAKPNARLDGLILASYLIPQLRLGVLGDRALARLGSRAGPKVLEGLLAAEAKLVTTGDREAITSSFRTSAAQTALTNALLKESDGRWIGRAEAEAVVVDLTANRARDLFRQVSRLGDTATIQRGSTTVLVSALPNDDRAEFTTAGPTMRYFAAASGKWTTFRFTSGAR